ncbi:MAG: hypothetical protein Q7T11_09225 [Deltaproteobacteria bacterium]|nr:hypothetical protein [Deltaproteobacteria bacterium]
MSLNLEHIRSELDYLLYEGVLSPNDVALVGRFIGDLRDFDRSAADNYQERFAQTFPGQFSAPVGQAQVLAHQVSPLRAAAFEPAQTIDIEAEEREALRWMLARLASGDSAERGYYSDSAADLIRSFPELRGAFVDPLLVSSQSLSIQSGLRLLSLVSGAAIPPDRIAPLLEHPDSAIVLQVISLLRRERALGLLRKVENHPDPMVQIAARRGIWELGDHAKKELYADDYLRMIENQRVLLGHYPDVLTALEEMTASADLSKILPRLKYVRTQFLNHRPTERPRSIPEHHFLSRLDMVIVAIEQRGGEGAVVPLLIPGTSIEIPIGPGLYDPRLVPDLVRALRKPPFLSRQRVRVWALYHLANAG